MKTRSLRVLGAAIAVLLPACGGDGEGSGSKKPKKAFAVTLKRPKAGKTYTAPATVPLKAVVADPGNVAKVEFFQATSTEPLYTFPGGGNVGGGRVVATSVHPPFQATWTDAPAGIHTLVAVTTDNSGAQTLSNTVTISVLPPDEKPGGWVPISRLTGESGRGLWFVDAHRGWIAGSHMTILHTVDGGATWVAQLGGIPAGTMVPSLLDIQFVDAERGWTCGGALLRTTDGGGTWTPTGLGGGFSLSFVDTDTGWVSGGAGEEVRVTRDGGLTWTPLPTGLDRIQNTGPVHFVDRLNGWVLASVGTPEGFSQDVLLHTPDGGLTWTEQVRAKNSPENPYSDSFIAMDFVDAKTGWIVRLRQTADFSGVVNNGLLATSDGGATWTELTFPESDAIFALDFVSPKEGWGVGTGSIIHTDDGGQSWETQYRTGPGVGFANVHFIDPKAGWALRQDGLLLKTTTGGKRPKPQ